MGSITKLRHPLARIPASDNHGLCLSRCGLAGIPPVDPRDILYERVCTNTTGQLRSQSWVEGTNPIYMWAPKGVHRGRGSWLLLRVEYYRALIYDGISQSGGTREVPGVGEWYLWPVRCGKGGNEG